MTTCFFIAIPRSCEALHCSCAFNPELITAVLCQCALGARWIRIRGVVGMDPTARNVLYDLANSAPLSEYHFSSFCLAFNRFLSTKFTKQLQQYQKFSLPLKKRKGCAYNIIAKSFLIRDFPLFKVHQLSRVTTKLALARR